MIFTNCWRYANIFQWTGYSGNHLFLRSSYFPTISLGVALTPHAPPPAWSKNQNILAFLETGMASCDKHHGYLLFITVLLRLWFCHGVNFITLQTPDDCKKGPADNYHEFFDISQLRCTQCAQARQQQTVSEDGNDFSMKWIWGELYYEEDFAESLWTVLYWVKKSRYFKLID